VRQLIKKIRYGRNFGGQREDYAGPGVGEALIEAGHTVCATMPHSPVPRAKAASLLDNPDAIISSTSSLWGSKAPVPEN
jgi:hypothetical protein